VKQIARLFVSLVVFFECELSANERITFEDVSFRSDVLPVIQKNIDSTVEDVSVISTPAGIAIVSIVATPNKLLDGATDSRRLLCMMTTTLLKGKAAISKFIQSSISSTNTSVAITTVNARQGLDKNIDETVSTQRIMRSSMRENSSMVMANTKPAAHWYTEDNSFFKRAVIFVLVPER